ncbi:MAG: ribonuclease P protein component 2 [Candidatus Aenigmarchaeota archaeon]|nr:ribonuclease P protein component 2 [Candidatus Aenigmarchaeota archaeon]NIP40354.1 ribonuclease P protein component 2 [Candidatus Aenigmarchaeota archaeon]NIQ18280.1 ribonuclease P protein component 2 [Candidatus Aenigmarchaeota archaeon]NIS73232.1 ribonuclease P protein component 2 [Candidatus Aenigmarchaeota archaeon]
MKLKGRPTLKEKKRYVFFKVHSSGDLDYRMVRDGVMNSLLNWLGDKDLALAKPRIIKNLWDQKGKQGVIRCSHRYVDDVKVSLGLVHQIGDSRVIIQTTRVSGTIKSGKRKNSPRNQLP